MRKSFLLLALALLPVACARNKEPELNIIPLPLGIEYVEGRCDLGDGVIVGTSDSLLLPAVAYLERSLKIDDISTDGTMPVTLSIDNSRPGQGYSLSVRPSGIEISGGSYEGVVSAISTLRQILWDNKRNIPALVIEDSPRFAWRGVMLDVSRHFFTVGEVTSLIDEMALYKLNRLHLHLTDDQGWRLEIKSYPELTGRGAWRAMNRWDSTCVRIAGETKDPRYALPEDRISNGLYGGFYTQEEMRGIIRYAMERGVEIVPEIDMPGHSLAVLQSYPQLSCDGKGGAWGKNFSTPLCLGNDEVLSFCKSVLGEVFELFPSVYVHIGGDEVERAAWEHCPKCAERVRRNGLGGAENLQAWFTREMEKYCRENGKVVVGWDEIASDGLSEESVVMWWRNWSPSSLKTALEEGHPVVMSPSEYYYLADEQDKNTLAKVYEYEPGSEISLPYSGKVIGIQGNLWSEKAATVERVGERMFPRLLAIAESAWTQPEKKDFDGFVSRLPLHLRKLDEAGWSYRFPDVGGVYDRNVITGETTVTLEVPENAVLHYTLDGTVPELSSPVYEAPLVIKDSCELRLRCYNSRGVPGELRKVVFLRREYLPAIQSEPVLSDGLLARWYDFAGSSCEDIDKAPLNDSFVCRNICIPDNVSGNIGLVFDGYIHLPSDGVYAFYTYSDDGSGLWIDGELVVDNDGLHSREEKTGSIALRKGLHKFSLRYFDSNGGILEAGMTDEVGRHIPFPEGMLKH